MTQAGIYKELAAAVAESKSEQSQVNGVARVLAALGYSKAADPEVHQTTVDRSTFRVYLWRNTPFGDHLVLATGPSFVPKLALASEVPAEPGVGFYIRALVTKDARTLAGAGRTAARETSRVSAAATRSTTAADIAAAAAARRADNAAHRAEQGRAEAEATRRAQEANARAAEVNERARRTRAAELAAARESGRSRARAHTAEEASRRPVAPVQAAPDVNKAMAQAQALIAMLKAQKSA